MSGLINDSINMAGTVPRDCPHPRANTDQNVDTLLHTNRAASGSFLSRSSGPVLHRPENSQAGCQTPVHCFSPLL